MGNPGDRKEYQLTSKNLLIFSTRKILPNKYASSAIKSVIPSPIKQQFSSHHPIQASFVAEVIAVVLLFLTSDFMYSHAMLMLINQCLLNVVFSIAKVLDGQSSPKVLPTFYYPHLPTLFGKIFSTLPFFFFFFSNLINFQLTPRKFGLCGLCVNQI